MRESDYSCTSTLESTHHQGHFIVFIEFRTQATSLQQTQFPIAKQYIMQNYNGRWFSWAEHKLI